MIDRFSSTPSFENLEAHKACARPKIKCCQNVQVPLLQLEVEVCSSLTKSGEMLEANKRVSGTLTHATTLQSMRPVHYVHVMPPQGS